MKAKLNCYGFNSPIFHSLIGGILILYLAMKNIEVMQTKPPKKFEGMIFCVRVVVYALCNGSKPVDALKNMIWKIGHKKVGSGNKRTNQQRILTIFNSK